MTGSARNLLGSAFLVLILPVQSAAPLAAQTASLVRDIETGESPSDNTPYGAYGAELNELTPAQGKLFFVARREGSDADGSLWVTDGTPQGTRLLLTSCRAPGECGLGSDILDSVGGIVLFVINGSPSDRVWRSDGTEDGTFLLHPRLSSAGRPAIQLKGSLFFSGCDPDGCGLWKTNGNKAGTVRISTFPGGQWLRTLDVVGGRLLFTLGSDSEESLWSSDGTAAGTAQIHTLAHSPLAAAVDGTRLFIATRSDTAARLWVTDGTAAGTRAVRDFPAIPSPFNQAFLAAGGRVYFTAIDGSSGEQLWTSDGTAAGTYSATAFGSGHGINQVRAVGGRVVFQATDGLQPPRLWASDGGRAAAVALADLCPDCAGSRSSAAVGSRVLFLNDDGTHGIEPWITDGTAAGTHLLADLCPGRCSSLGRFKTYFQAAPGGLLFVADDGIHGWEIWRTDGTAAGTARLTDVDAAAEFLTDFGKLTAAYLGDDLLFGMKTDEAGPALWMSADPPASRPLAILHPEGASSLPRDLFAFGDRLLFKAGREGEDSLWSSQGTPETTQPLGLTTHVRISRSLEPTRVGSLVFVRRETVPDSGSLWRTDGTAAGTAAVADEVSPGITAWQGKLLFASGRQIWQSDGTEAGTVKVLDFSGDEYRQPSHLTGLGPELYFLISDIGNYSQLWRCDGTPAGTRKLLDVGSLGRQDLQLTRLGGAVYFLVGDERRLWRTDGTPQGTVALAPASVLRLTIFQGALYFFAAGAGDRFVLWRSDGTAAGTVEVTAAVAAPADAVAGEDGILVEHQGRLWFAGDDGTHGLELWSTDGTAAGTRMASDIRPGAEGSEPAGLAAAGGRLFFAADDGVHGTELWQSDGTAAGTRLVQDLAPFAASSFPSRLTAAGDRLYFVASDGPSGYEVWSLPLTPAGTPPVCQTSPTALCLNGGRFRVEARWRDFQGNTGMGKAVALTGDTGWFWFFDPANVEVVLKTLDGRGVNGHFWVFYGALSSVEYLLTVTDTQTGAVRQYFNPSGQLSSLGDTNGFGPLGAKSAAVRAIAPPSPLPLVATRTETAAATGSCQAGPQRLCLAGGRFAVTVSWKDFGGHTGQGTAVPLSGDTGWFWFFDSANLELMVKVLDGTGLNGKHWVFYGALSSVEYTLEVTDTATGTIKTYHNPPGRLASAADTGAF